MLTKASSERQKLSRWSACFFFWNTLVILMVGVSYISMIPSYSQIPLLDVFGKFFGISFVVLAFIGQSALFAFASGGLAILLIQCVPKRGFALFVNILFGSLSVLMLAVDAILYHLYHYHLFSLLWNILISGAFVQIINLSSLEWLIFAWIVVGVVCLELLIAFWVWQFQLNIIPKKYARMIVLTFSACLFLSYGIYFSAAYVTAHPKRTSLKRQADEELIISEAKIIPYYVNVLNMINLGVHTKNSILHYPLQTIKASVSKKPYNIIIIAVDSWRYDTVSEKVTPHIAAFSKHAIRFTHHYSGGNATRPGIFSLFYSLPSTYWSAMLTQGHGPVFIQQLLKSHYQLGIFSSAGLTFPALDKTVFRDVPNLSVYTPGNSAEERDANITTAFNAFVNQRKLHKPFFGFLFYDAAHGYCEPHSIYPKPFQPAAAVCNRLALTNKSDSSPYLNRYKNAVLYDDTLVGQVLRNLKRQHLLKNTIVIVTADHGEEFNDEHLNYWGHASAFDPYQLRTPLIVYWPGLKPDTIDRQTSHYDVVPTLMKKVLGVRSPTAAYSVGHSLFSEGRASYLVVGSYMNYAVLEPNRTIIMYSETDYDITYPNAKPIPKAVLDPMVMRKVHEQLNRYYQ